MHSFTCLQYGENEKAKLNVPIIKKHKGMLQSFSCLKRTLTFKKTDMKAAVTAARLKVHKSWLHHLKHDEIAEWDKATTNRIMTLCRHTSQGTLNARAWAKDLHLSEALDEATGSAGESATQLSVGESAKQLPSAEVEQAASAQSVWFGYDHELKQAWRKVGEQRKEFSDDWLMQGADTDAVQVRFQDGFIREVAERPEADAAGCHEWPECTHKLVGGHPRCIRRQSHHPTQGRPPDADCHHAWRPDGLHGQYSLLGRP